jgi:hypothetical protein
MAFGAIILDCTFLWWRWVRPRELFDQVRERYDEWLRAYDAPILAFPQDDFDHSRYLDEWLADLETDVLFSVYRQDPKVLYPRLVARNTEVIPSLAAYVDDDEVAQFRLVRKPFRERSVDVAYRVRRLPANFGRLGMLKSEFGRAFARCAVGRARCDISDDPKDVIYGEDWLRFLGDARFALGSEGGSSVIDPIGEVQDRVQAYVAAHPQAEFDEVAAACLKPEDEAWDFPALSPRIFESAMAGNCPILVEGEYSGLIAPEEHFIPVKKDFSDIGSAVDRLADIDAAERMAARFEEAILGNEAIRYKTWVETVIEPRILDKAATRGDRLSDWEFAFRLEQHRSALAEARASETRGIRDEMQARLNEADAERRRVLDVLREEQERNADPVRHFLDRPAWRVIGSVVKAKLRSR